MVYIAGLTKIKILAILLKYFMEDRLSNLFNDGSSLVTHCPVCNLRYDPVEARVLEESDNAHLFYIRCRHCQAAVLAVVTVSSSGISSVGLVTDLTSDDVIRFKSAKPITCDDVIEVHEQLLNKDKVLIDHFVNFKY